MYDLHLWKHLILLIYLKADISETCRPNESEEKLWDHHANLDYLKTLNMSIMGKSRIANILKRELLIIDVNHLISWIVQRDFSMIGQQNRSRDFWAF